MSAASLTRLSGPSTCSRCLFREVTKAATRTLHRSSIHTRRKLHGTIIPEKTVQKNMIVQHQPSFHDYFSANTSIDRGWVRNGLLAAWQTATSPKTSNAHKKTDDPPSRVGIEEEAKVSKNTSSDIDVGVDLSQAVKSTLPTTTAVGQDPSISLPHRRRRRSSVQDGQGIEAEQQLPLDASSQLTTAATNMPLSARLRRRFATYLSLTKPRLSFLIILTTTSAYSLYPIPEIISSATHAADASSTLSTSTLTLTFLSIGTFLSSASANTFNMLFEPKYDAMMTRTRNRPLVRKLISTRAASVFAVLCGAGGVLLLYLGTNPTVAGLSALNVLLYAGVYTPMKRISPINTWVGAIVGGIPPLMGWCAAVGETATSEHHAWQDLLLSEDSLGGWLLAGLLFAWQFPHFNSLSHLIRDDYRNAGHKMLAWTNPARNARVALRYSFLMFPICGSLYWAGLVNPGFLVISTACNLWMTKEAVRFWKKQGAGGSARGLFWASVWQLPLVLVGALVCKTGIWDGFFEKESVSIYEGATSEDSTDGESLLMESAVQPPSSTGLSLIKFGRPG